MADNSENRPSIYYIPENFLGESRLLNGQIRTRYLIDSVILSIILAAVVALPLLLFVARDSSINVKATILIISVTPGFLAGQIGHNGDPISVFLLNVLNWQKKRQVRLYNDNPRLLGTDPVKALYESNRGIDKLVGFVQSAQEKRIAKKTSEILVEGETFEFEYDPGIDGYLEDSGDYADDDLETDVTLYNPNLAISLESDLGGLESFVSDDWQVAYTDLPHEIDEAEGDDNG